MARLKYSDLLNYRPDPPTAGNYEAIPEANRKEAERRRLLRERAFAEGLFTFSPEQLRRARYETGLAALIEGDLRRWGQPVADGAWIGALSDALAEFPDAVDFAGCWHSYRTHVDRWLARRKYWQHAALAKIGTP